MRNVANLRTDHSAQRAFRESKASGRMVFRAAAGITTLLIGLNSQAVAQYYPSPQAYPRQPLPPAVSTEELPPLNAPVVRGDALSPPVGVGPAYQPAPGGRYQQGSADAAPLPPTGPGYQQPQDGPAVPDAYRGAVPPGPPGSFKQCNSGRGDAIAV